MNENIKGNLIYYTFELFDRTGQIRHAFSSKSGGVSSGCYESMNLGLNRGDKFENVFRNFEILCSEIGVSTDNLVLSQQTHTTNVRAVTRSDCGNGILQENAFKDIDGLMTNKSNVALVTFYADCVPLLFFDPIKKVVASSHAGWRGTLGKIAENTLKMMSSNYGSKVEDILVGIGPSICYDCYEVDEPVYTLFESKQYSKNHVKQSLNGKKKVDLREINKEILVNCGVKAYNIEVASNCTKCNSDIFFSHRVQVSERGSLAAIMELM